MGEVGIFTEDDRVELIEGEIIQMTPIGSPHAGRVARLNHVLMTAVGDRAIVQVQNPVILSPETEPQPDLMLLRPREDFYTGGHPQPKDVLLLIEVAHSSLNYDRNRKIPLYAAHGIPEVWLVDVDGARLIVFRALRSARYDEEIADPDLAHMQASQLPGINFDLSRLL